MIVVANKIDVDYKVTKKSFKFPKDRGLPFYFVSAADGTNVVRVFQEAIEAAWNYKNTGDDFVKVCFDALISTLTVINMFLFCFDGTGRDGIVG